MSKRGSHGIARRRFLGQVTGGIAAAAIPSCLSASVGEPRRRPNVIYAFSDEHRWQSMSCGDMPAVRTPNMEALASQGVSFSHCISNYPVCSPHRAILMTGRWPYQQGVIDNSIRLDPGGMTLGKAFKAAGYDTAYIGKWHLGGTRAEPFGFSHSLIWTNTNKHWDASKYHPKEGKPVQPKGYNATLMTDQALAYIDEHRDAPFFLMLSWNPPHSDFLDPPKEKEALYPDGSLPPRENVPSATDAGRRPDDRIWNKNSWPHCRGYHAHVSAIDDELGRIMSTLDELGLAQDTILVYSSDHGTMMGSHGLGSKRQPYEESIRVPFIVRWPGEIPAGAAPGNLFGTIDVAPTLCSIAGVSVPGEFEGQDFSPVLHGQEGPDPEAQLIMHISKEHASHGNQHPAPLFRGLRTRRYTYAHYPDRPWCLFDNNEDPYQLANLIDEPDKAPLRKELDAMLRDLLRQAGDGFRLKNEG